MVSCTLVAVLRFDTAILPVHLIDLYKDYPKDMFICKNDEVMYVAQKSVVGDRTLAGH